MKQKHIRKIKEPVTIRQKALANGNYSLYLDIYRDGVRKYEFLKLYLIPERTPIDKLTNQTTLRAAKAIQAERTKQIINTTAGIKEYDCKILLIDWMQKREDDLRENAISVGRRVPNSAKQVHNAINHLKAYIKKEYGTKALKISDVDKEFLEGFAKYLNTAQGQKNKHCPNKQLAPTTRGIYFKSLTTALNFAVKDGLIDKNPMQYLTRSKLIPTKTTERLFLTADELRTLIKTPCNRPKIAQAFLFSCFCGLRFSDVEALTWGDIHTQGDAWQIQINMVKTHGLLYLPLSKEARAYIPERGNKSDTDKVFDLRLLYWCDEVIKKWVKEAGINKNITFHCARHTFATLMLTLGADLYTTSKLLGHHNIQTTEIYAKIVDEKKNEAVNLTNGLFDRSQE